MVTGKTAPALANAASPLRNPDTDQHAIIKTAGGAILVGEDTFDADMMDAANQIRAMKRIEPHI
jgi:hypothetical protein